MGAASTPDIQLDEHSVCHDNYCDSGGGSGSGGGGSGGSGSGGSGGLTSLYPLYHRHSPKRQLPMTTT